MRITFICTERALFRRGSAAGNRMIALARRYNNVIDSIVFSTRKHGITKPQELTEGVHAYPTNSLSRWLYGKSALRIAKNLQRPDIVSAQDPFETGLIALWIARYWKVPLAIEMHTDFLSPAFKKHSFFNRIRLLLAGYVLRHAAGGYVVSEGLKQKVLAQYHLHIPIFVLPIYVDIQHFSTVPHTLHPKFKTALLWVGRMEKEKQPELALRALITARRQGFDVGLTFVGTGRLLDSLQLQAKQAGVAEWVEFVGNVSDVAPYYAQANLVLMTSVYEGYGMVIVEALAAGIPVLATNVGIAREAGAIIVDGTFDNALCKWLAAPTTQGILKVHPYASEDAYFDQAQAAYQTLIGTR